MGKKLRDLFGFGVKFKTAINGMLLSSNYAESIIKSTIDELEISLDGLSIEENNFIRRDCDFFKTEGSSKVKLSISSTQFLKHGENFIKELSLPKYI